MGFSKDLILSNTSLSNHSRQLLAQAFDINPNDRAALSACCAAILDLQNSWNPNEKDPIGHLAKCFADELDTPFYARHKSPEGEHFEAEYGQSHQTSYALATSSGEAAISLIIQGLSKTGDTLLVSEKLFGTSKNNFKLSQSIDGRKVIFVDLHDFSAWQKNIGRYKPAFIFVESPSNPLAELADIRHLKILLNSSNNFEKTKLIVDSTYAPAPLYQPLALGADIILESATKFIDGQTRVTGGIIATKDEALFEELFRIRNAKGYNQVGFNALSLSYNLRSLNDRVIKQSHNALTIAKYLHQHPKIEQVFYLGLPNHAQHMLAKKDFVHDAQQQIIGYGSMLAFTVKGDEAFTRRVGNSMNIDVRVNLGSIKTILTHPFSSTHSPARLTIAEVKAAGVVPNLLRLSIGLEPPENILEKIEFGLKQAQ